MLHNKELNNLYSSLNTVPLFQEMTTSTHRGNDKCIQYFSRKTSREKGTGNLAVDEIMIKLALNKCFVKVQARFQWFITGS
jgi:hypothetical protein